MNDEITVPLLLKELRLPTMIRMWEDLANEAVKKGWSHSKYLARLCDCEVSDRESRRLSRHLIQSKLPKNKSLENFDFSEAPRLKKPQIYALGSGKTWIDEGVNLLIFGPSGLGKTHLAAGVGEKLIESGYRVLFERTSELLQRLQSAKRDFCLPAVLEKLDKYDCLILDDFGYVKKNEAETGLLFELIDDRYERRSLIVTCNQPFKDWEEIFDDKRMAIAAADRLIHHATLLELSGESYRKRAAMNKISMED